MKLACRTAHRQKVHRLARKMLPVDFLCLPLRRKKKTNFEKHDEAEEEDKDSGVRGKGISA